MRTHNMKNFKRVELCFFSFTLMAISLVSFPAKAQFWPEENEFSRQIVYATCGEPQIPVSNKCFCGGLLAYDNDGSAGLDVFCDGQLVPNIIHKDMTTSRMLRFLIHTYYGPGVTRFCDTVESDGTCEDPYVIAGIGSSSDEAYFVGHFTGALLGEERCLLASQGAPADQWALGPSIGEMDRTSLNNPAHFDAFQRGCRNNYRNILHWLEQQ